MLAVILTGCHRRPFNLFTGGDKDSTELLDIYALQRKSIEAENEVIAVIKADSTHRWAQHEFGWWYRYTHKSDEHIDYPNLAPGRDTCCLIHETVYDLNGRFIIDAIREFDPSVGEPFSYELMLREMVDEDTVIMLVPWNFAYGTNGNSFVRPYTNIRTRLTRHSSPYIDIELTEE